MQNPYAALLRVPGGPAFSAASFVARLPISMLGIAIVLLVSSSTGRYGLAGAVSATFALAGALVQPRLSRYIDKYGQTRAVPPQVVVSSVSIVALIWLADSRAPSWVLFLVAFVAGAAYPNVGALVRARWSKVLSGRPELRTAYSLESILDEVIFVVGPPFVTLLAAGVGAGTALLSTVAFLVLGSIWLLAQRSTEPDPAGAGHADGPSAFSVPGLRVVTLVMVMLGGVFGSVEVVTVAFAGQRHRPEVAGLLLALYAGGSMCAGIVYGARPPRMPLRRQLLLLSIAVPFTVIAFPFVASIPGLAVLAFLAGVVVSPTLIASFQLVETLVPPEQLTEGLTWATTGITFGVSISAAVSGRLVDAIGTPHAYVAASVCGLLTAVAAASRTPLDPCRGPFPTDLAVLARRRTRAQADSRADGLARRRSAQTIAPPDRPGTLPIRAAPVAALVVGRLLVGRVVGGRVLGRGCPFDCPVGVDAQGPVVVVEQVVVGVADQCQVGQVGSRAGRPGH